MSPDEIARDLTLAFVLKSNLLNQIESEETKPEIFESICKSYLTIYNNFFEAAKKVKRELTPHHKVTEKPPGW